VDQIKDDHTWIASNGTYGTWSLIGTEFQKLFPDLFKFFHLVLDTYKFIHMIKIDCFGNFSMHRLMVTTCFPEYGGHGCQITAASNFGEEHRKKQLFPP